MQAYSRSKIDLLSGRRTKKTHVRIPSELIHVHALSLAFILGFHVLSSIMLA